ncbi:MAG: hypothetical protein SFU91_03750 [Chloroherpetonaceae bacterium]|nr:hypothetical protein [Chloroherpetonaceae bacterium]
MRKSSTVRQNDEGNSKMEEQKRSQKRKATNKKAKGSNRKPKEIEIKTATPRRDALIHLQYELMIERKKWIRGESSVEKMREKASRFIHALETRYRDKFESKRGIKFKLHPAEIIAMPLFSKME